jgi:broad specificity phosphatase PhoE
MAVLYLVRHAKPAATWGEAVDPGLDALGAEQAARRAEDLNSRLAKLPVYTSPLRRCVETSQPLTSLWRSDASILNEVAEIPSPPVGPTERRAWLDSITRGTWSEVQAKSPPGSPDFLAWRKTLLAALQKLPDSVVYTHYIAINVAVGAAQGHDRMLSFQPGHASVTVLELENGKITVRELGAENPAAGFLTGR